MNVSMYVTIRSPGPSIRFNQEPNVSRGAADLTGSATKLTISPKAKMLSQSTSAGLDLKALDDVKNVDQLKAALKGADFSNMSPRETASLASALDRTGKFDEAATSTFFIALNTETPLPQGKKVDVVKHFDFMLENAREGAKSDSDFASAVKIREKGSQLLKTLIGWSQSDSA